MRVISLFCFCWWILVAAGASGAEVSLEIYPAVEVEFQTETGRRYRLESATNLATWEVLVPEIIGSGSRFSVCLP